ncbi:MAG: type II toxin-antitoxin system ChpB family toxin [Alphaproteobacteria bacterium]|nr:type II toxin-antitoxin system ChpB family toxin [Alphaproteobacteria bacterium]
MVAPARAAGREFHRGDIVRVSLEPIKGHEQGGSRPALVISTLKFNCSGDVLVAPITSGGDHSRFRGFAVDLAQTSCETKGFILVNKIRMLDLEARNAVLIDQAPTFIVDDVLARLRAILSRT